MRYIVDRIEEDRIVCENEDTGELETLDSFFLPDGLEEGDILQYDEETELYVLDQEEKLLRKARIENRMEDIWEIENGNSKDLS